ncbi:MAG: DNA-directed RNA polymerase subunit N [Nanoarchaeota archaeon]
MIIPVRCFSCGKPIGSKWEKYQELLKSGKSIKEALDELKLERFCCRGAVMSHVDMIDTVAAFK